MVGRISAAALIFIFASAPLAEAKRKISGASLSDNGGFLACVESAVLGYGSQNCPWPAGSPACLGLKRSLEHSQKKASCLIRRGAACEEWGFSGLTQAEWASIASGHLADFGNCIKKRYGTEENPGLEAAAADSSLIGFLKKLDDGSQIFRLTESAILIQTLNGDRFGHILETSPWAKDLTPHELYRMREAADTPARFGSVAKAREALGLSSALMDGESVFEVAYSSGFARPPLERDSAAAPSASGFAAAIPERIPAAQGLAFELSYDSLKPQGNRRQPSPYSLGLDRSLFERVSSAYQRKELQMRDIDEFAKLPPSRPRDLGELLSRGGTL